MTRDEFLSLLEASKDQGFDWFYKRMSHEQELIRATKKTNGVNVFCPITVVAYMVTGRHYQITEWPQALKALKFSEYEGCKIMRAADNSRTYGTDRVRLRNELVSITEPHAEELSVL